MLQALHGTEGRKQANAALLVWMAEEEASFTYCCRNTMESLLYVAAVN